MNKALDGYSMNRVRELEADLAAAQAERDTLEGELRNLGDRYEERVSERDEARAEAAALRGAIDTVMAIPSMTANELEELKRNCRAAIEARKEGE